MNRICRIFIMAATLVAVVGLPGFAVAAPNRTPQLGERIHSQFPLLATLARVDGGSRAAVSASPTSEGESFLTRYFNDEFRISSARNSVRLRADLGSRTAAVAESAGHAYHGAFGDADALRISAAGVNQEIVVADGPSALRAVSYAVVGSDGIVEIVNEGRAVRFITTSPGPALRLSAPLAVDSAGRPSLAVRWIVDRSAGMIALRLRVDDHALRYPVAVTYTVGAGAPRLAGGRAVRAQTVSALADGSIAGFVRNSLGTAVGNAAVYAFDSGGSFSGASLTDSTGAYLIDPLPAPANYYLVIFAEGYTTQLYNGFACDNLDCTITAGTAIAVASAATTNVNVTMTSLSAQITGHVLGVASVPLDSVVVTAYDNAGVAQGSASTDATGEYHIFIPFGGTFYARTFNTTHTGYLDQLYSGIDCTGCTPTSGTPIVVAAGGIATNINFTLNQQAGRIAGSVTDGRTGAALPFARVTIYNSGGTPVSYADVDTSGAYISFQGLAPGNYYALATYSGYTPQAYNNKACSACNIVAVGNAIVVSAGATTSGINFPMNSDVARVSGSVTDATSHAPLVGALVRFFDTTGTEVVSGVVNTDGSYSVVLPGSGTYFAKTSNQQFSGYLDQSYNGHDCSGCNPTTGDAISVTVGVPVNNIDFALSKNGGRITGTMTDANTHAALAFFGFVQVYSSTGAFVTDGLTDGSGVYSLLDTLATGDYFVVGRASGYGGQLYNGISCAGSCNVTAGTAVHVTKGQTTSGIDFALSSGVATITGTVRPASDPTLRIDTAVVSIYDSARNFVGAASSDASGVYAAQVALSGTYYAVASHLGFADQLWDHKACAGCDVVATGTAIAATVNAITSGIDFDLIVQCTTLVINPATLPNGTYGDPYSQTVSVANDTVTLSLSGTLPPGLTFDPATGIISGTFTAAGGPFTFTITATDANGCTGSQTYMITVAKAATTTSLIATPSSTTFGSPVTFTATVSPSAATGTVDFIEGATTLATVAVSGGSASFTTSLLNAGVHGLFARYSGDANYLTSDSLIASVNVAKATPVITWSTPAPITYGTPLSSTQLNATANVPGTFVYIPAAGAIVGAGSQTLSVTFTPTDTANYNTASASVTLTVDKATPSVSVVGGTFTFDGNPHPATGSVTGVLGEDLGTPTFTYNGGTAAPVAVGTYTVVASFAGNANYLPDSATVTITIITGPAATSSISKNFTGQAIAAGRTIWFNSVFDIVSGLGSATTSIFVTGQTITFTANGTAYSLPVPDARVILNDPTVTQPTTTFDTTTNVMTTQLPGAPPIGNTFLAGLPFVVPAGGLPGGIKSVTWTGTFSTNSSTAMHLHWRWAANVFTSFSTSYNALGIKPVDASTTQYPNNDPAGTPESFKSFSVNGGSGGLSSVANIYPPAP